MLLPCRGVRIHGTYMNPPHLSTMCPTVGIFESNERTERFFFLLEEKPMDNFLPREVFEEHNKRMEAEHERQNARISQLEKAMEDIKKITVSVERLAISMENMTKELERQGKRLDEIEDTPRDRWNTAVKAGITTVVGTIIGALITGIVMFIK